MTTEDQIDSDELYILNRSESVRKIFITLWITFWAIISLAAIVVIFYPTKAHAFTKQDEMKAVIGEAEDQGMLGMTAVACAINNRGNLHGVYGLRSYRVRHHKYSKETYLEAEEAVENATNKEYCKNLINEATFWEGTKFPTPYWARGMVETAVIGDQKFYQK